MKRIILALFALLSLNAFSQLETGTTAPDFTLTDWYGEEHHLYSYLDDDKTVILEIFAAHCPGCWAYHQTNRLKNMYNMYGPEGTDELMVLALEHDIWNGYDAFNGIGDPWTTQGNWLEGTPYPLFNPEEGDRTVFDDYNVTYYPVVYMICPDKTLELLSTSMSEETLYEKVQACALTSTEEIEPELEFKTYPNPSTGSVTVSSSVAMSKLTILNLLGEEVIKHTDISSAEIELPTGMYILKAILENGEIKEEKLIVH